VRDSRLDLNAEHLSDHDLERYYLGTVTEEEELAPLEEHILSCAWCAERADEAQHYVDRMRAAMCQGSVTVSSQR